MWKMRGRDKYNNLNDTELDEMKISNIPYGWYFPELFLGDFNDDEKYEIMLRGAFAGSGHWSLINNWSIAE